MNLDIPYFSQNNKEIPADRRSKYCGICCVKMVVDYFNEKPTPINELIKEAELIGAFDEKINNGAWTHEGLVRILRNHDALAYQQEFRSVKVDLDFEKFKTNKNQKKLLQKGIEKILAVIKKGNPVIASVKKGFGDNQDSHLILIKGYQKKNKIYLIIHDPLDGPEKEISLELFLEHWRKLTIFTG